MLVINDSLIKKLKQVRKKQSDRGKLRRHWQGMRQTRRERERERVLGESRFPGPSLIAYGDRKNGKGLGAWGTITCRPRKIRENTRQLWICQRLHASSVVYRVWPTKAKQSTGNRWSSLRTLKIKCSNKLILRARLINVKAKVLLN